MGASIYLLICLLPTFTTASGPPEVDIPSEYEADKPPAKDGYPANVTMKIELDTYPNIQEINEVINMHGAFVFCWKDHRITSNHTNGRIVSDSYVQKLWTPSLTVEPVKDLVLTNAMKGKQNSLWMFCPGLSDPCSFCYNIRASVTLICKMDFTNFPMDVHACSSSFFSTIAQHLLNLKWDKPEIAERDKPIKKNELSLPNYIFKYMTSSEVHGSTYPKVLKLEVSFYRHLTNYVIMTYFPSGLMVVISWGSFLVPPDIVPGRMVLMVTNLLTLVTMFNSLKESVPKSSNIKPIELWIIVCIGYITAALLEYAIVLFGFRQKAQWGQQHKRDQKDFQIHHQGLITFPQRTRVTQKVYPLAETKQQKNSCCFVTKKCMCFLWMQASRDGMLDLASLILFPISFIVFNIYYWLTNMQLREDHVNKQPVFQFAAVK